MADTTPNATSKAWTYDASGYPQSLRQSQVPISRTPPTPHSIILRTHAAAINPVDIQYMNLFLWSLPSFSANHARVRAGQMGLGEDFAGTVLAAGAETGVAPGDEIFGLCAPMADCTGSLSDIAHVNAKGAVYVKKPPQWSWTQAASVPLVWLTAYTMVEAVVPRVKSKVAVLGGSSAVGMYIVHLARQKGWEVLSSCSGRNVEFVKSMGASRVVDYTKESVPAEVKKYAPDAIIDCVGGTECLSLAPRYVTIVGDKTTRLFMGGAMGYWWNPQMVLRRWLGRLGLGVEYDCLNIQFNKGWLEEVKKLPLDKIVIDSRFPSDQVKEAFERLNTGRARGKVVVTFDE